MPTAHRIVPGFLQLYLGIKARENHENPTPETEQAYREAGKLIHEYREGKISMEDLTGIFQEVQNYNSKGKEKE